MIKIIDSMLNKEYIHKGIHRMVISFKGQGKLNGETVNIVLRAKHPELICFVDEGREKNEIRFIEKFNHDQQYFELELTVKQLITPDQPSFAGFLISGRNTEGNTASEEFILQCR